jgi:hypothetical protein
MTRSTGMGRAARQALQRRRSFQHDSAVLHHGMSSRSLLVLPIAYGRLTRPRYHSRTSSPFQNKTPGFSLM